MFPLNVSAWVATKFPEYPYPEAQALAVDICDTVEFFYRKDPDDASRRAKCQRWGVVYLYQAVEKAVFLKNDPQNHWVF